MASVTDIKIELSGEMKDLLMATRLAYCFAESCKYNHDYGCALKNVMLDQSGKCQEYEQGENLYVTGMREEPDA